MLLLLKALARSGKLLLVAAFALLPFAILANTEIGYKNGQIGKNQSVIKDRQKQGIEAFKAVEIAIKPFVIPPKTASKPTIKGLPIKLVIDDVIVFRTETSAADNLVAYSSSPIENRFANKNARFYTPG